MQLRLSVFEAAAVLSSTQWSALSPPACRCPLTAGRKPRKLTHHSGKRLDRKLYINFTELSQDIKHQSTSVNQIMGVELINIFRRETSGNRVQNQNFKWIWIYLQRIPLLRIYRAQLALICGAGGPYGGGHRVPPRWVGQNGWDHLLGSQGLHTLWFMQCFPNILSDHLWCVATVVNKN